ncbi:HlyD family secretion protein [Stappia sp. MMSF_3263]|uniref:HlyD family secretion protein n=1 Tax=Stappia sp. MMSF_3263 TaxID=3046693 RepID=UPI0027401412|nr:HlyD family secretion protein [Stappia sp. MMSF_3263]
MFELIFCSLVTILPDYLYRRYVQGKRIGREITLYSVWFELRYGIVTCAMLTVSVITMVFYYHPTATGAVSVYRTVPILPDRPGRVAEIYIDLGLESQVKAGEPIFRLDSSQQQAEVEIASKQVGEIEADLALAQAELRVAQGQVDQATAALTQASEELATRQELMARNANVVSQRDIERLENTVSSRQGGLAAAIANREMVETKISVALPARLESATARLKEAEVALTKTTVHAGVDGTITQFNLRVGDIVNPVLRPAGLLIPADTAHARIAAGFGQIEAKVIKVGMVAEIACAAVPFTVIPMVVTEVQASIGAGQVSASDRVQDVSQLARPASITALLEPLYPGGLDEVPPGSQCIANAYTSNHERLATDPSLSTGQYVFLHVVDTVGVVHAAILRLQVLLFPIRTLVLSGH